MYQALPFLPYTGALIREDMFSASIVAPVAVT